MYVDFNVRNVEKEKFQISIIYEIPAEVYNGIELISFFLSSVRCYNAVCAAYLWFVYEASITAFPRKRPFAAVLCVFRKRVETVHEDNANDDGSDNSVSKQYASVTGMAALIHWELFLFAFEFGAHCLRGLQHSKIREAFVVRAADRQLTVDVRTHTTGVKMNCTTKANRCRSVSMSN